MGVPQLDKGVIFRLLGCIVLVGMALGLYLVSRPAPVAPTEAVRRDLKAVVDDLDRDVDTVLAHFRIEQRWVRKRQIEIPGTSLYRIERRVQIPQNVLPMQVNLAFNTMAKRYEGRAVGSENLKESTVTIHIGLEGYILQTIVLKPTKELPKAPIKPKLKKT